MVSRNNYKIEVMSAPPDPVRETLCHLMTGTRGEHTLRTHFHSFIPLILLNSEWQCREEARARLSL